MARILIAWELGAGLGHLTHLTQLGRGLLEQQITARHLAAAGLVIHLPLADPAEPGTPGPTRDLRSALQRLIDEPTWKIASSNMARDYFQDTHAERSAKLLDAAESRLLKTIG